MLHNATLFRFLDDFSTSKIAKSLSQMISYGMSPVREVSHLLQK